MTWCIILLEVAIRGWEHGGHKGMDPIATKGPKVCQENMPHTSARIEGGLGGSGTPHKVLGTPHKK